jgi:hypothetical protein
MPAPAHDASRPNSPRSITRTCCPPSAKKYAEVKPMMPPPMTSTSDVATIPLF